jgi:hypothetical protein
MAPQLIGRNMKLCSISAGALSLTAVLAFGAIGLVRANATTFDLTLTPDFGGTVSGSGTLVTNGTFGFDVEELDITLTNGDVFNFSGASLHQAQAVIHNGELVSLQASDFKGAESLVLFDLTGILTLPGRRDRETFERVSAVDPTPLPPTWTMMLIGILGIGLLVRRSSTGALNIAAGA